MTSYKICSNICARVCQSFLLVTELTYQKSSAETFRIDRPRFFRVERDRTKPLCAKYVWFVYAKINTVFVLYHSRPNERNIFHIVALSKYLRPLLSQNSVAMEQAEGLGVSNVRTDPCDGIDKANSFELGQENQTNKMKNLVRLAKQLIVPVNSRSKSKMPQVWGYQSSVLPPDKWHQDYPIANGKNQSPVDIKTSETEERSFPEFNISYKTTDLRNVVNNGHSVTFFTSGGSSVLSGGPLSNKYSLEQFHFHWGSDSCQGSEHLVDGKSYAAEVHLVHWNSEKYSSFAESLGHPDGLCVLGAFLQSSASENENYGQLVSELKRVQYKGDDKEVENRFDPRILLPGDISKYYHYAGSLTTPPLKECVQWVVFKEPVDVSESQLNVFRHLHLGEDDDSPCLCNNYRPHQNLGSRVIFST